MGAPYPRAPSTIYSQVQKETTALLCGGSLGCTKVSEVLFSKKEEKRRTTTIKTKFIQRREKEKNTLDCKS